MNEIKLTKENVLAAAETCRLLKIDDPVNVKVEYRNDATVILKRTNQ